MIGTSGSSEELIATLPTFKYRLTAGAGPGSVDEYRRLAKRAVPGMIWAFIETGAEDQVSLQANVDAFSRYALRARVLRGEPAKDLSVQIGGQHLSLPVMLSPAGLISLAHSSGEVGVVQAAERAGTIATLSTASSFSIEEVAAATERDHFFQLYPWSDLEGGRHDLTGALIDRAKRGGFSGLVVTVDVPAHGNRESERRNGMLSPPVVTPARVASAAIRPRWWMSFLRHRRYSTKILNELTEGKSALRGIDLQRRMTNMGPQLRWDDLAWIRDQWSGPLFIKGILDAEDAELAVGVGVDGIIVSNHGGRQLDGTPAALDALPAIAAKVAGRAQIVLDGGVRRGSDVVKALCLGADAVSIGRPYVYGLAARGSAGAEHVIEIFREEIERVLTLMGVARLDELNPSWLLPAGQPVPVSE